MINIQDIIPFMKDGWVAMDKEKRWFWSFTMPEIRIDGRSWCCCREVINLDCFTIAPADDWTKSLIQVDHFSQEGKKVGGK